MQEPAFISGANKNSFAYYTLHQRLPYIIANVISDQHLTKRQIQQLNQLSFEVSNGYISEINSLTKEEYQFWNVFFEQELGKTYSEVPFFKVEAYFYRRIMQIMGYPATYADPFKKIKQDSITENTAFIHQLSTLIRDDSKMEVLLKASLWGNSADLSQINTSGTFTNAAERGSLIIDDTTALEIFVKTNKPLKRVDYVADNAGIELLTDLFLIDHLISEYHTAQIVLHLKSYPTFVSDATIEDALWLIDYLLDIGNVTVQQIAYRIKQFVSEGRIIVENGLFWNSPCHFTEFPLPLKQDFCSSSLIIFKGDANYRRLFEDRNWPLTEPVEKHLRYLENNTLVLRTLKSELMLGLSSEQVRLLNELDKNWLTNGEHGMIMFNEYRP